MQCTPHFIRCIHATVDQISDVLAGEQEVVSREASASPEI